jgi:hypothetical protein
MNKSKKRLDILMKQIRDKNPKLAKILDKKIENKINSLKSNKKGNPGGISDNVKLNTSGQISIETIDKDGNVINKYVDKT